MDILNGIKDVFTDKLSKSKEEFKTAYGKGKAVVMIAVALKLFLFYYFVGVTVNFVFVWLLTCIFAMTLFSSFKNKWIPAIIYLLLSIVMFADVTYNSFFSRYLSFNLLGSTGMLADIKDSILEVIQPSFFLILADAVLILILLAIYSVKKKRDLVIQNEEIARTRQELNLGEEVAVIEDEYYEDENAHFGHRRIEKKKRSQAIIKKHKNILIFIAFMALLIWNPFGLSFATSLANQEIVSYHIKDAAFVFAGGGTDKSNDNQMIALINENSYKNELDQGPLFGIGEGKNLVVIQVESLQDFVIGMEYNEQEITPNLNALIKSNSIYFDNYYQQVGSGNTSDAEFATNNSIYGTLRSFTYQLFPQNSYRGLPVLLKEKGYETAVFHAHEDRDFWNREEMYESQGFDKFYGGLTERGGTYDMTEWMGWGLTDSEFIAQTIPLIEEMKEPFYSFVITISNHHPYIMLDHYNFIDLLPEDEDTIVGNYLRSAAYTDYSIGLLLEGLKEAGLYENTVFAIYGDHVGLPNEGEITESMGRLLGMDYDYDGMMNVPLIITVPGEKNITRTIHTAGGQVDFLPTIGYIMGFETLDTIYLGHNLFTIEEGFVAEQTHMVKGSFFTDGYAFEMSRDGVFNHGRAWYLATGEPVSLDECYDGYLKSCAVVDASDYILDNDLIRKTFPKGTTELDEE